MKHSDFSFMVQEANGTPTAAALVGNKVNSVLELDAQVRQNLPTTGNPSDSQPFIDSLARAPMTGCTSLMDLARLETRFNPLDPTAPANPVALIAYVNALLSNKPLFVTQVFDQKNVHRQNADWNQVVNEIVALYPVQSPAQQVEIRESLVQVIGAGADRATMQLISQHTLQTGQESIGVFVYLSSVLFEKRKDGKGTTHQLDFVIHRAILHFQAHLWNEVFARKTAMRHFKGVADWLEGMNSVQKGQSFLLSCFRNA